MKQNLEDPRKLVSYIFVFCILAQISVAVSGNLYFKTSNTTNVTTSLFKYQDVTTAKMGLIGAVVTSESNDTELASLFEETGGGWSNEENTIDENSLTYGRCWSSSTCTVFENVSLYDGTISNFSWAFKYAHFIGDFYVYLYNHTAKNWTEIYSDSSSASTVSANVSFYAADAVNDFINTSYPLQVKTYLDSSGVFDTLYYYEGEVIWNIDLLGYPTNPMLKVQGITVWNYTGQFIVQQITNNFGYIIDDALDSCETAYCNITYEFSVQSVGQIAYWDTITASEQGGGGSSHVPPISEVIEDIGGGATFQEILHEFNPVYYDLLKWEFSAIRSSSSPAAFFESLAKIVSYIFRYILREPAALVPSLESDVIL